MSLLKLKFYVEGVLKNMYGEAYGSKIKKERLRNSMILLKYTKFRPETYKEIDSHSQIEHFL